MDDAHTPDPEDEPREFPVGDLWVDLDGECVRLPDGSEARRHTDWDRWMVCEESIVDLPLCDLSEAFAALDEAVQQGEGYILALQDHPHNEYTPRVRRGITLLPHDDRRMDVEI